MSVQHPIISFEYAISHQDELIHQADVKRLAGAVEASEPRRLSGARRRVGQALVQLGERLQTTHRRAHAGDLAAAAGALRISR
ncbi:MAG TPA: hypothetical protein VKB09_05415 [Thermomicrobiales bacterium]|nr:hypothetical protein [Thermomicrobiales bacterium]